MELPNKVKIHHIATKAKPSCTTASNISLNTSFMPQMVYLIRLKASGKL